jgi:hypothetical protein
MSRFGDQFAARKGVLITCLWPDVAAFPAQKADKPLWNSDFPPTPGLTLPRPISSFASPGGFVIRCPARTQFALFLGSSAVEHSTVNRMVAGSNPARGATHFKHLAEILEN